MLSPRPGPGGVALNGRFYTPPAGRPTAVREDGVPGFLSPESKGELERFDLFGIDGVEGWLYPSHVETDCSRHPDGKSLRQCEEPFASPETSSRGRVVNYPEERPICRSDARFLRLRR